MSNDSGYQERRTARVGSLISGTLRSRDLVPAYTDALERLDGEGRHAGLAAEARLVVESTDKPESQDLEDMVQELTYALEEFAPPYCYFGSHPGDGADFGYWPDWDAIEGDRHDGTLSSGDALPDTPAASGNGHYLHISDHGNAELYTWDARQRRWRSEWGLV